MDTLIEKKKKWEYESYIWSEVSAHLFVIKALLTLQVFSSFVKQLLVSFYIKLKVDCVIHH